MAECLSFSLAACSPKVACGGRIHLHPPVTRGNLRTGCGRTGTGRSSTAMLRARAAVNAAMAEGQKERGSVQSLPFGFPHIGVAAQEMMSELLTTLKREIGCDLLPSQTAEAVRSFRNPNGNAEGSVMLWAGKDRSYIDRVLLSSLHCELPFGTLNFATLVVLMGPSTDAPHLLFEFPFNGTSKVTMVMDLLPRKDLSFHVEYLHRIYENSPLPDLYKQCEEDKRLQRYITPSLYIRSAISPTALLFTVDASHWSEEGETAPLDAAIRDVVHPLARRVLATWLDAVRERAAPVDEGAERERLAERDAAVRANGIESDLTSNLPRLFGEQITAAVLDAFRKGV